jgi:hypothetical protein
MKAIRPELIESCYREVGLDTLPNDLTRMLYLASLRDCNTGRYLHPKLSPTIGTDATDSALCACHYQVFRHLLATGTSGYVTQLEEYIRYASADRNTFLRTWESLGAYRATIPLFALPVYGELFCLETELAIAILKNQCFFNQPHQDTTSR